MRSLFTSSYSWLDLLRWAGAQAAVIEVPPNRIPELSETITPAMLPLLDLLRRRSRGSLPRFRAELVNVQDIYPLAPLQEGIFFHHLMTERATRICLAILLSFDSRSRLDS